MAKKQKTWADAKKICRLNSESIEKAKKLGLSPRTLISNHSSVRQEPWKAPVREWIDEIYDKRFGKKK